MTHCLRCWYQKLWSGSWLTVIWAIAASSDGARAQITPDSTLGAERSIIVPNVTIGGAIGDAQGQEPSVLRINGGAQRGANLFHSFQEFNVKDGQRVDFTNPTGVQNILTRVTGGQVSNILGTLGVDGSADLFLLNPSGIIFGQNAQLDVRGSFVGTTANAIRFGEQGVFSATNPQAPPLLTVNPSALLFNQLNQGSIVSKSLAKAGKSPTDRNLFGLRVSDSQSLLLVGGDVQVDGGGSSAGLTAQGGRIELGGLASAGALALDTTSNSFRLTYPFDVARSNVSLINDARVSVRGTSGGDVVVNANAFTATNDGRLVAGTEGRGNAGNITVNASTVNLAGVASDEGTSGLFNQLLDNSTGNGGNITVNTNSLNASSGAYIGSGTLGRGNAGNVIINARDTVALDGKNTAIFNDVGKDALGQGGDIRVTTGVLSVTNGAQLLTDISGQGDAGNVIINARDITFQGSFSDSDGKLISSGIYSPVATGAIGKAGDVRISTNSLSILDNASISTFTRGKGNAGNIFIEARDHVSLKNAIVSSDVQQNGVGKGGTIQIRTESLSLADISFISSSTNAQGNAGSITIDAGSLSMTRSDPSLFYSGDITTSTTRQGNAGNIAINVRDTISIDKGAISTDVLDSGSDDAGYAGKGKGGDIRITTGSLHLTNAALLFATSTGQGDAGNIVVNAGDTVSLDSGSIISTSVNSLNGSTAIGRAGDIQINARSLFLTDGGYLSSMTGGQGNAATIDIRATDQVVLDGGSNNSFTAIDSTVSTDGVGQGGDIQITTGSLSLSNHAVLLAGTGGQGDAGNVIINARDRVSFSSGARLFTNTSGQGNAGNVTIRTGELSLDGVNPIDNQRSGIFSSVEQGGVGRAGNIDITADSLSTTNGGTISAVTNEQGLAGDITIKAADRISVSGTSPNAQSRSVISTETGNTSTGDAGNITLDTERLRLSNGAYILASTFGQGKAGNVTIHAGDRVSLSGVSPNGQYSSTIASVTGLSGQGNSGSILIDTRTLNLDDQAEISVTSFGSGEGGQIQVQAKTLQLNNRSQISAETATTNGGDISLSVDDALLLRRGSRISTNAGTPEAGGNGGNITINANNGFLVTVPTENSDISADAYSGKGGNVRINAQGIFGTEFRNQPTPLSDITATSDKGPQFSGTVQINTPDVDPSVGLVALPAELVDASRLIASGCLASKRQGSSKFIVTGRGGLPYRPIDAAISPYPTGTVRSIPSTSPSSETPQKSASGSNHSTNSTTTAPTEIVEAQGWVINNKGLVVLTASAPTATPYSPLIPSATCRGS